MTDTPESGNGQAPGAPQSFLPFDPAQLTKLRMTQAELARLFEVSKQTVSQWLKRGVIVAGPDGRIDPHRAAADVMKKTDPARLRARIFKKSGDAEAQLRARVSELEAQLANAEMPAAAETADYHRHRSERERYAALAAKLDYETRTGQVLRADDARAAVAAAATNLRVRLESLPDTIAPRILALRDENAIRLLLREEIEHALTELSRQFQRIAAEGGEA